MKIDRFKYARVSKKPHTPESVRRLGVVVAANHRATKALRELYPEPGFEAMFQDASRELNELVALEGALSKATLDFYVARQAEFYAGAISTRIFRDAVKHGADREAAYVLRDEENERLKAEFVAWASVFVIHG